MRFPYRSVRRRSSGAVRSTCRGRWMLAPRRHCRNSQRLIARPLSPLQAMPTAVVDRHPDRDLAGRGRSLAGSDRLDVVRLIRPAFPVERGRLDRLGRAPLLHDLELAAGPAVPSCVRRVLRSHAVGH